MFVWDIHYTVNSKRSICAMTNTHTLYNEYLVCICHCTCSVCVFVIAHTACVYLSLHIQRVCICHCTYGTIYSKPSVCIYPIFVSEICCDFLHKYPWFVVIWCVKWLDIRYMFAPPCIGLNALLWCIGFLKICVKSRIRITDVVYDIKSDIFSDALLHVYIYIYIHICIYMCYTHTHTHTYVTHTHAYSPLPPWLACTWRWHGSAFIGPYQGMYA